MDLQLKGKTALITGASRGIGNRIARCLAEEGANVFICGRTEETLQAAAEEITALGVEVGTYVGDVTETEAADAFVAAAAERFGADLLVDAAINIARALGVSEAVIGLTMVAIGTSLPELAATIAARNAAHCSASCFSFLRISAEISCGRYARSPT